MSSESDILYQIDFTAIISDFAVAKSNKSSASAEVADRNVTWYVL